MNTLILDQIAYGKGGALQRCCDRSIEKHVGTVYRGFANFSGNVQETLVHLPALRPAHRLCGRVRYHPVQSQTLPLILGRSSRRSESAGGKQSAWKAL